MFDNDLARLFIPLITSGLAANGFGTIPVIQNFQPTQEGTPTTPTVYYAKIFDHRFGFLKRISKWIPLSSIEQHVESQRYETRFQIMATVIQSVNTTNTFTASDLVNGVAAILQSDSTVMALNTAGVGILRITEVSNPYAKDDRDEYEGFPSFDFTLTHKQTIISTVPVLQSVTADIYRV